MLTRSDCWEPLERRSFHYLQARFHGPPTRSGNARREPRLEPAPVDRVIRAIRAAAAD